MIIRTIDDLPRLMRDRRRELGLSQQELADVIGVNRAFIGFLERGERAGRFETVLKLVQGLSMDIDIRPRQR